jgi:hypothetical protein
MKILIILLLMFLLCSACSSRNSNNKNVTDNAISIAKEAVQQTKETNDTFEQSIALTKRAIELAEYWKRRAQKCEEQVKKNEISNPRRRLRKNKLVPIKN